MTVTVHQHLHTRNSGYVNVMVLFTQNVILQGEAQQSHYSTGNQLGSLEQRLMTQLMTLYTVITKNLLELEEMISGTNYRCTDISIQVSV